MTLKFFLFLVMLASTVWTTAPVAAEDELNKHYHGTPDESAGGSNEQDAHADSGSVILTVEQIEAAGIVVEPLQASTIHSVVSAPGEVTFNIYKTASISPRITAQVIGCHVVLGQIVQPGQAIVSLSSVEMAEAQGALLLADREWQRVKKLGKKVVSESRYTQAKVNWELARAKVRAYGMTKKQINDLLASEDFSRADGHFELIASHGGTVLRENYILGQQVEPGHELIRITNEADLWVVAKVSPAVAGDISIGNKASVHFDDQVLPAKVIQMYHSLDETTRTSGIRLAIKNTNEALHPGMFVNTKIETSKQATAFALPEEAVLRSPDGDWIVMVQTESGEFKSQEITLERVTNGKAIISGIEAGTPVVVKGGFFVWSESAKAGFDAHDH